MQISSNSSQVKSSDSNHEDTSSSLSSEERYKTLVANIPGVVYRCTCDFTGGPEVGFKRTMAFLSEAVQEISGYPPSDFINDRVRSFASIIHPQDRSKVETVVKKSVEARNPYILEYRILRADGGISWVYEKGQAVCDDAEEGQGDCFAAAISPVLPMPNSQYRVVYLDGVILDITERKRAEENLRNTQEFLNAVLKNLPVSVFIKDAVEQRFIYWNTASEELFGYSTEEVLGQNASDLFSAEKANYLHAQDIERSQLIKVLIYQKKPSNFRAGASGFCTLKKYLCLMNLARLNTFWVLLKILLKAKKRKQNCRAWPSWLKKRKMG